MRDGTEVIPKRMDGRTRNGSGALLRTGCGTVPLAIALGQTIAIAPRTFLCFSFYQFRSTSRVNHFCNFRTLNECQLKVRGRNTTKEVDMF